MNEEKIKEKCKRTDIAIKVVKGFLNKDCYPQTELYYSLETLLEELDKKDKIINTAFKYVKKKQSQQYKYALSKIECDELIKILKVEEENE